MIDDRRICSGCGIEKHISEFFPSDVGKKSCRCKVCRYSRVKISSKVIQGNFKKCSLCGETKPLSEYHKHSASPCGVVARCKTCSNKHAPIPVAKPGFKFCATCKVEKPHSEFNRNSKTKCNCQASCKICQGKAAKEKKVYKVRPIISTKEGYKICSIFDILSGLKTGDSY